MGFWTSGSGNPITGRPEDAFQGDFSVLPEGTVASAMIKSFMNVDKENKHTGVNDKYILVTYRLLDGDFKSREVSQKIKCYSGKPEQIDRALNMLKLIMQLCDYKPTHDGEPQDMELLFMTGKIVTIKIGEWSMPKADGGIMSGNFVREVWVAGGIPTETGVKTEVTHRPTDSALQRNAGAVELPSDDIPF